MRLAIAFLLAGCFAPEVRRFDDEPSDANTTGSQQFVKSVSLYITEGCGVLLDGTVRCWGANDSAQLGVPPDQRTFAFRPLKVPNLTGIEEVAHGARFACVRDTAGGVACWGDSDSDGDGSFTTPFHAEPTNPVGLPSVTAIRAHGGKACAIAGTGELWCWHIGGFVGSGTVPEVMPGLAGVTQLFVHDIATCAVAGGSAFCVGGQRGGLLGDGVDADSASTTPVQVQGLTDVTSVVTNGLAACAARTDGTVSCWGSGSFVGGGPAVDTCRAGASGPYPCQLVPAPVPGLTDVVELGSNGGAICARKQTGTVACWGGNNGQFGDGTTTSQPTPTPMSVIDDAIALVSGSQSTTCVIRAGGELWCTGGLVGYDADGQPQSSLVPVPWPW